MNNHTTNSLVSSALLMGLLSLAFCTRIGYAGTCHHLNIAPAVLNNNTIPGTPVDIACDASGHVIVVTLEGQILSLSGTGSLLTSAALPGTGTPVAVTMNNVGDIYVAKNDGALHRLNTGLSTLQTASVTGTPVDLTVAPDGTVFVITTAGTIFKRTAILGPLTSATITGTPTSIFADGTGNIFATIGSATGNNVFRLNTSLTVLSQANVPGVPVDISANSAGDTIVAVSAGQLHRITPAITVLSSRTLSGTLVTVDLDDAGHVLAVNSSGSVFVANTGLSSHTSAMTGSPAAAGAINLVGDIYVIGGTATVTPAVALSVATLPFPDTAIGTATASLPVRSFDVTHISGGALSVTVTVLDPTEFEIVGASSFTLSSGSRTVDVRFRAPTPAAIYSSIVRVVASAGGMTDTKTLSATGRAFTPTPQACYTAGPPPPGVAPGFPLGFGSVNAGTSRSRTFTIENCGTAPLQILSASLSTPNPAGIWALTPVVSAPITLAIGGVQTFTLTLAVPASLGVDESYTARISITTDDGVGPPTRIIDASGTGHVPRPRIRIASTLLDYRQVELGFAFTKAIVIDNDGDALLQVDLHLHPTAPTTDRLQWSALDLRTTSIAPGAQQLFLQVYEPTSASMHALDLQVTSNDGTAPSVNVMLRGEGITPVPMDTVLVLDRSGSMSGLAGPLQKIQVMQTAADLFAHLLAQRNAGVSPVGDKIGFVKYNHANSIYLGLDVVTGAHLTAAENALSDSALGDVAQLRPDGATGIGGALQTAAGMLVTSASDRKHIMVVLTDGIQNRTPNVEDVLPSITTADQLLKIYSVGLGSEHDAAVLNAITTVANGYHQVQDDLSGVHRFDLEAFYFKIFANAADMSLVVDPTHPVRLDIPDPSIVDTAEITSSDRSASFVILELPELRPFYDLEFIDPHGNPIVPGSALGGVPIHQLIRLNYRIFRVIFPDRALAHLYVGTWTLRLRPNGKWTEAAVRESFKSHHNANTTNDWLNPYSGLAPIGFGAAVHSNYRMKVDVLTDSYLPGAKVQLAARLTDRAWPAPQGRVTVTATTPDKTEYPNIPMYDDGTHGDAHAGDAVFTTPFVQTGQSGSYQFFFQGVGRNDRGELTPREDTRYLTLLPPRTRSEQPIKEGLQCIPCPVQWLLWVIVIVVLICLLSVRRRATRA